MIIDNLLRYIYDRRFVYQFIGTLSAYLAFKFVQFYRRRQRKFKILEQHGIPGPKPSLIGGNLDMYRGNGGDNLFKLDVEMKKKYGKVFGYFSGEDPSIVVSDLDMLKSIFVDDKDKAMRERKILHIDMPLYHGIVFAKYDRWKTMKKVLSPHFSKYTTRGQICTEFIEDTIRLLSSYIEDKFKQSSTKDIIEVDIRDLVSSATLRLISSVAIRLPTVQVKEGNELVESLEEYLSKIDKGITVWATKLPCLRPVLQFLFDHFEKNKTIKLVKSSLRKTLADGLKKLREGEKLDDRQQAIDVMIKLHHDGLLTEKEVMGSAEGLLIAGYDTTATTLGYVFWVLAKHQTVQEKLRSELISHGIESEYLTQVVNETLRLYPINTSFTARVASKTFEVGGWTIPKGVRVMYNGWLIGRDTSVWQDPEKFDPDRFAKGKDIHPCAFAPFGLGGRKCLGYQLALLEMNMIICDLLLSYKFSLKSPETLDLTSWAGIMTTPKEKIILELTHFKTE